MVVKNELLEEIAKMIADGTVLGFCFSLFVVHSRSGKVKPVIDSVYKFDDVYSRRVIPPPDIHNRRTWWRGSSTAPTEHCVQPSHLHPNCRLILLVHFLVNPWLWCLPTSHRQPTHRKQPNLSSVFLKKAPSPTFERLPHHPYD